ncbi:hypothetical protein A2422_01500 [Candidatus Woesebacteria bacterium RIFOXYC1_FULL_31_51]|uniref:Uncharacterized protein n=1 Tax=Candidatus Woesebacteria bacterium GW2011_GWC2_31_9 TaxID=1618586 RepID=A0A0F9YHR9_9BACT|nr:MAG: hypothetical protein UR17_C0001G0752 [Candidatus Woesebacteria bacterium GW2011_GWF1_31_35]KKP22645.1 MAG: hypothetical protein UR11_C0002G0025 [Candidatus Woesebacteria bacterium GW2011_GWC1_30_29]KKP26923.1 MAG: hypothetical protein UR13_C0001G0018 [Candidatus Woesebacteria bacterium GW2011_GWD1_31_12]KKP27240.1 MAG: hypothetical protein UR16_C0005G0027 [Candidatus Woesebacteria bacterium GW2011_GWB1_31_29]KKP30958.1 MAG: hypothetical protein UR21_C0019G0004 [Candidatus Woesebacteria 
MKDNQKLETNNDKAFVLRIAKPNLQIIALIIVALITILQSFQLAKISSGSSTSKAKTVPATTTNTTGAESGAESGADTPQSMVGGC